MIKVTFLYEYMLNKENEGPRPLFLIEMFIFQAQKNQAANALGFLSNGEPDRIRTCDPLIKSQLLYQLSYGPPFETGGT